MSAKYGSHISNKVTPQSSPIFGESQVENNAGGYVYEIDDWKRLDRFLILGSEGGTYYASEKKLTVDNAKVVSRCLSVDFKRTIDRIVEISSSGGAPKNDPALLALAIAGASSDLSTRKLAFNQLNAIARIPTHLFHFVSYITSLRGWGRSLRTSIGNWYINQDNHRLVQQVTKYQSRDGWSNRDLLRLSHPKTNDEEKKNIFDWITHNSYEVIDNTYISDYEYLKAQPSVGYAVSKIQLHSFPRELIPTELLNSPEVWEALLERMPMTALIRNLNKMTAVGLLKPLSKASGEVCFKLRDVESIKKSRLHPLTILTGLYQYQQGHGDKGKLSWNPVPEIIGALNEAFYLSFHNVEPTNKRYLIGLDVSGSMATPMAGSPLSCRAAGAALCLTIANTEPKTYIHGFSNTFVPLPIYKGTRLEDAIRVTDRLPFMGTDCALPMLYALHEGIEVDVFVVITDNETWVGRIHPSQALKQYRNKINPNAKLVVIGMTSTGFSIADPNDGGMMDCVGFESALPEVISNFVKGF